MKKRNQLLALCALVILVLTVFACENPFIPGKYKEPAPPQAPAVSVEASPIGPYVKGDGLTITAKASVSDAGELSYQWYSNSKNSNSGGNKISGATGESYRPSTNIEDSDSTSIDTTYYYVQVTNTLHGRSTTASSRTLDVTVYDVGTDTPLREVNVTVVAPVKGATPAELVNTEPGYSLMEMEWDPWPRVFQERYQYTVIIKIQAENGYTLIALRSATINGHAAAVKRIDGNTVELSYKFSEMKGVDAMVVKTQPTTLTYTHGNALDLSGLVITVTYSDGTTEDVTAAEFAERDIITTPAHDSAVSHTNNDGRPIVVSHAGVTAYTNNLTVNKAVITATNVSVVSPLRGESPKTTTSVDSAENYTSSAVSWTVNNAPFTGAAFEGSTQYTATVTLTVKSDDYIFASGGDLNAEIGGFPATASNNTGTSVTVSYQFEPTSDKVITAMTIASQPSTLTYTHGDTLNLNGLAVTVTYEGADPEVVQVAQFQSKNIMTRPANGVTLTTAYPNNHNVPVEVSIGAAFSVNTEQLTVNAKELTITGVSHSKTYDGNATVTGGVTGVTFTGTIGNDNANVSVNLSTVNAEYTTADVGSTMKINGLQLSGSAAGNYYVAVPVTGVPVTSGITQATPTVTWPTAANMNHSSALSTSALSGGSARGVNNANVPGTFAWTNPSFEVPGNGGLYSYQVTFTPTSGNYRTMTANVNVGVSSQITFNYNYSGSPADVIRNNVPYQGAVTPPANPTRTSYTFSGWCTSSTNTTPFNLNYVTGNATVYARWILNSTVTAVTNVTNSATDMAMVYVCGGSYSFRPMLPEYDSLVTLSSFYIGKYEVTQEQFQSVMNKNPSQFTSNTPSGEVQAKRPVERVSFYDALEFCNKLTESKNNGSAANNVYTITGITRSAANATPPNSITSATVSVNWNANGYRLPTWAEWQYAAKGGPQMKNPPYVYAGSDTAFNVGWFGSIDYNDRNTNGITHEVGKKAANELGTYDMSGNVPEWCWDMFDDGSYGDYTGYNNYSSTEVNPKGKASGTKRMVCSGTYYNAELRNMSNNTTGYPTTPSSTLVPLGSIVNLFGYPFGNAGFRVARNAQ